MAIDLTKFIGRFAEEAREHLETINNSLVSFEKNPDDLELLDNIFRSVHTIKGSSKILKLVVISDLSHKVEDIFDALRSQKIQSSASLIDLVLQAVDRISEMVEMASAGTDTPEPDTRLIEKLEAALDGELPEASPSVSTNEADRNDSRESDQSDPFNSSAINSKKDANLQKENESKIQDDEKDSSGNVDNWLNTLPQFDRESILMFIPEAREHIENISNGLLSLEKELDPEILNDIFRSAHGIKGSARMVKLKSISGFAHNVEDILDGLRNGKIQPSSGLYDLLLEATDILSELVKSTEAGQKTEPITGEIVTKLEAAIKGQSILDEEIEPPEQNVVTLPSEPAPVLMKKDENKLEKTKAAKLPEKTNFVNAKESVRVSTESLDGIIKLMGEIVSNQNRLKYSMLEIQNIEKLTATVADRLSSLPDSSDNPEKIRKKITEPFNELFLQIGAISSRVRDDINMQELLTHELQDKALKMRMMPLSTIFNTFNRTIRDLSRSVSKNIEFTVEGGETELDKKMIEKLGDPLMHMIRNAIDHGIELPEVRRAKGKPEAGSVNLSANYEGGAVVIKLQDDGAGMSKDKLIKKALEKNLFSEDEVKKMSDKDIYNLVFHPGISTSVSVTDISGRGVGMDVVKRNIVSDLKGSIQIETVYTQGTAFCIRLPLTLSIMSVLLIESAGMIFALSSHSVSEVLRVPKAGLIDVMNRKAIRLREHLIPVVGLDSILKVPGYRPSGEVKKISLVIVLQMGTERLGLIVDSLISEEDMVIKPLPSHLKSNEWVTGIAITGKNELVNVMHIPMLFTAAGKIDQSSGFQPQADLTLSIDTAKILVVDDAFETREIEKNILEKNGYTVHVAEDGEAGLAKAKSTRYDLIVTDCDMPKMDGFELTKNLREDQYYRDKPIIIVTGRDKEEDRLKGMKAGADAYIVKGAFDQTILLETVDSLIG